MHNIMNDELNDDWINNFEENDKLYKDFYKDNLCYVNIDFIYINKNNEINILKNDVNAKRKQGNREDDEVSSSSPILEV